MQIARTALCGIHRNNLRRDLDEILLALEIKAYFSKQERLSIYLNTVYFGGDQFGIAAASKFYFNTSPNRLTLPQSALLIGLIRNPAHFDPTLHPDRALERRNVVLAIMETEKSISTEEAIAARNTPISLFH